MARQYRENPHPCLVALRPLGFDPRRAFLAGSLSATRAVYAGHSARRGRLDPDLTAPHRLYPNARLPLAMVNGGGREPALVPLYPARCLPFCVAV